MNTIGFDRQKYITLQSQHIKERRAQFGGRLYLEMGGKTLRRYARIACSSRFHPGQ